MLYAYDIDGARVKGEDADKEREYMDTLFNQQKVIPVQGDLKVHHFRYDKSVPKSDRLIDFCNESEQHREVKYSIYEQICEYNDVDPLYFNIEHSYSFGRIADIGGWFEEMQLAIEVVHKHLDYEDYLIKKQLYHDNNIKDVWIFTPDVFTFEKGHGTFHPIMEDLQNRFGVIYYYENGDIESMRMEREHSATMRYYDRTFTRVGWDFEKLWGLEENYRLRPLKNKLTHLEIMEDNLKSRIEELSDEITSLEQTYGFMVADNHRKDEKTPLMPYFNFDNYIGKEITVRLLHLTPKPNRKYKTEFIVAIDYRGNIYHTKAPTQLQQAFKKYPNELLHITYHGLFEYSGSDKKYKVHEYTISKATDTFKTL